MPLIRPSQRLRQQQQQPPEIQDEPGLLRSVGGSALSGLAMAGNFLDVPGSMVRDTLAGENPFDQLLSPLSDENRTTGRGLLEQYGVLHKNRPGLDAGDVGGFAAEVALDPLTYLTFGASAAAKAGKGAKGLSQGVRAGSQGGNAARRIGKSAAAPDSPLAKFLQREGAASAQLTHPGLAELYVRKGPYRFGGERLDDVLQLARVATEKPGTGQYRALHDQLVQQGKPFIVEAPTPEFAKQLKKMGYEVDPGNEGTWLFRPPAEHAAKTGEPVKGLREGIRAGERGLARLQVPFTDIGANIGTGKLAERVAGGLESVGSALRYNPVTRAVAAVFDPRVKMRSTNEGQRAAKALHASEDAGHASVRQFTGRLIDKLHRAGLTDENAADGLRAIAENSGSLPEGLGPDAVRVLQEVSEEITPRLEDLRTRARSYGMNDAELEDLFVEYFPRYRSRSAVGGSKASLIDDSGNLSRNPDEHNLRAFLLGDPSDTQRKEILRNISGGTTAIKRVAKDAEVNRLLDAGAKPGDLLHEEVLRAGGPEMFTDLDDSGRLVFSEKKLKDFTKWIASEPAEIRKAGVFGNHPLIDLERRLQYAEDRLRAAETFVEHFVKDNYLAVPPAKGAETVPLYKLLNNMGMHAGHPEKTDAELLQMLKHQGVVDKEATVEAASGLIDKTRKGMLSHLADAMGIDPADADAITSLRSAPIAKDLAEDFLRHTQAFRSPEVVRKFLGAVDSATNLFKSGVTSTWPAFHVRNRVSGAFQNWVGGMFSVASERGAHQVLQGRALKGAVEIPAIRNRLQAEGLQLTDAEGTAMLRRMLREHGLTQGHQGEVAARAGVPDVVESDPFAQFVGGLHGGDPVASPRRIGRKIIGRGEDVNLKPWNLRGVGQRVETTFGPAAAGQEVGAYIEGMNRVSPFIEQLKRGVDPSEAAAKVNAAQIDYSSRNFTAVDRELFQRAFPFWKFSSRVVPFTLRQLWERPGGRLAQTLRATNRMRDPGTITPDYVAQGMSVPIAWGQPDDGTQRYLTGAGLMHEDPFGFFGNGVQGAMLEGASRLNPIVKAPLEWMSGQSFFQQGPQGGRPLEDMDPPLGRTLANVLGRDEPVELPRSLEFTLANSPLSRFITTARTATDDRKWNLPGAMNLLTGLRVTDVSPAAQDRVIREHTQALAKELGAKEFARTYFPKHKLSTMSDKKRSSAEQLQALLNLLAKRAKERAKAKKGE